MSHNSYLSFKASENWPRLDQFLKDKLGHYLQTDLSTEKIKKFISANRVFLNEKKISKNSRPVYKGSHAQVIWNPEWDSPVSSPFLSDEILYEDNHFIAINKRPSVPSQSSQIRLENHCYDMVKDHVQSQFQGEYLAYVGLLHRLDRYTSGVLLFSKSKLANQSISKQFLNHRVKKEYLALCSQWSSGEGICVNKKIHRVKDPQRGYRSLCDEKKGKTARTEFELLDQREDLIKILARPRTGRTHQIRCHMAFLGSPLIGDSLYGSRVKGKLKLHALKMSFYHIKLKKVITIKAPLPEHFLRQSPKGHL